jgi:hypothetical protein
VTQAEEDLAGEVAEPPEPGDGVEDAVADQSDQANEGEGESRECFSHG